MTPSWLEAHASYIDGYRTSTAEHLTFNAGSPRFAALLKVPIIPADMLDDLSPVTLKIVLSLVEDIGKNEDCDPKFGVSDRISFIGFEMPNRGTHNLATPCFGIEGASGNSLSGTREISPDSPKPEDPFYYGQFVITLKLNKHWGSCYTAHDGGFVKTADYNKRLRLSKGLTLEVYRDNQDEKVGIKFIEVTVM